MNKENAIKRINTIGKVGSIISTICMVIMCIAIVCTLVGGIILTAIPKDLFNVTIDSTASMVIDIGTMGESAFIPSGADSSTELTGSIALNGNKFTPVNTETSGNKITTTYVGEEGGFNARKIAVLCYVISAFLAISIFLLFNVRKLCEALKTCETPFEQRVIKSIETCTWTLIPWVIFEGFATRISETAFSHTMRTGFNLSLSNILVILLLFGLGFIFKYGAQLQLESDETL